jgi:osmotically-inducible protein OsmY
MKPMRRRSVFAGVLGLSLLGMVAGSSLGQGVAEKAGETLDSVGRGLKKGAVEIGDAVRRRFDGVRGEVSRMGVQNRVYSRLHWDRSLNSARFEVHMLKDNAVLLRGYVADEAAHQRAVTLAGETVGVTGVVDELVPLVKPAPGQAPSAVPSSAVVPPAR